MPRGRSVDGLLLCYDTRDRTSFQRSATVICQQRMDRHLARAGCDGVVMRSAPPQQLPVVLCATKAEYDCPSDVGANELADFVAAHQVSSTVTTAAIFGEGVKKAFHSLVKAMLHAEAD